MEDFVEECKYRYRLDLTRISAGMKQALTQYKADLQEHGSGLDAVLVGTRKGDPFSGWFTTAIMAMCTS